MLQDDIDTILQRTLGCATPLDELALLRTALRKYVETGNAAESVAWAAERVGTTIISKPYDNRRPNQES